jgi:hypothetical protein
LLYGIFQKVNTWVKQLTNRDLFCSINYHLTYFVYESNNGRRPDPPGDDYTPRSVAIGGHNRNAESEQIADVEQPQNNQGAPENEPENVDAVENNGDNPVGDGGTGAAGIQMTEEDHASHGLNIPLFPLYQPEDETEILLHNDIDSASFLCTNVIKLTWIQCIEGRQFEFFSNFDRWVDRTTKSRYNISCDNQYQPTVYNKKRDLFGFEMLKNLKICKVKCGTIDFVFSLHLLDSNKVGNSMFWDDLCGAICLAMNTALVHPEWITGDTEMAGMSEYREGSKNIERFFVTKEGKRAFHSVEHSVGGKVLMFFQAALVQYSEQTVDQYEQDGEFNDREIHQHCYHGLPNYPEARLACIKKLLDASKYIVQNCTWSCVAAGLKLKLKSKEKIFKFGDRQQIHDFIMEKTKELQQRLENMFQDPGTSPAGANMYLPQNVIFQHDVGIEA